MNADKDDEPISAPRTARARARAEITAEILNTGRRQLAEVGADRLSLRAVAREMGMVSSAIYRYVPSRDALLTALIIDAYQSLGAAAREADEASKDESTDLRARFVQTAAAVRRWALDHPHEYALIYGSPVPGYEAPTDTIDPATEVPRVLLGILADLVPSKRVDHKPTRRSGATLGLSPALRADLQALRDITETNPSDESLLLGLESWAQILGLVSMELFGHLNNVVTDRTGFFNAATSQMAQRIEDSFG